MKKKLLLIGAGPTSSLIAYNIKKCQKLSDIFDIFVWEKSRGTGGRFSTSRSTTNSNCYADLGAQYLTWSGDAFSKPYFDNLLEHQLIQPFDTSNISGFRQSPLKSHYVCSTGTASIVKHLFAQGGESNIKFNTRADALTPNAENKIEVCNEQGDKEIFDCVVSTMPAPQFLQLKNVDNILQSKPDLLSKLRKVEYTSRYAMALFYDDKVVPFQNVTPPMTFVENDETIKYWSVENKKRAAGKETSEPCAIAVHTSTSYGAEHIGESPETMKSSLLEKVQNCITSIQGVEPSGIKCHKWRYSQVLNAYQDTPGFVEVSKNLIAAGDGFSYSGFEGCIKSAENTVERLNALI